MMKEMSSSWENVRISDFYKGKLRVLEWINFYFAVVGSGSGLVAVFIYIIYIYRVKLYTGNGMDIQTQM